MKMSRQELYDRIVVFLQEHAENTLENVDENAQLLADLGFNSLDLMNLVNDAEDEFGIVIDDEDMEKIVTVGDVVDLVDRKTEE
ncbi:MAG: acyl carrier protein [Lachnospiraceae bacterium]|nr:acyl carrier protein [Lachnospiraceae bacterium]